MTARTERHRAALADGLAGDGPKGMPGKLSMTAGGGQRGVPKEGAA